MSTVPPRRRYDCRKCGLTAYTQSMTGRVPLYCPLCRPRVAKRGGAGGVDTDTPAYRLALSTTTLRLGIERARRALLGVHLDERAGATELRRAVAAALAALNDAETDQTRAVVAAELLLDVSAQEPLQDASTEGGNR